MLTRALFRSGEAYSERLSQRTLLMRGRCGADVVSSQHGKKLILPLEVAASIPEPRCAGILQACRDMLSPRCGHDAASEGCYSRHPNPNRRAPRSNLRRPSRSNVRLLMSRPIHCLPRYPSANTQKPIRYTTWRFNTVPAKLICTESRIQRPDWTTIRCWQPLQSSNVAPARWTIGR
jgi:hypothetical protein